MKKLVCVTITLCLLTALLLSCQTTPNDTPSTPILNAKIAQATGFKTSYSEFIVEIDDLEVITQLKFYVSSFRNNLSL